MKAKIVDLKGLRSIVVVKMEVLARSIALPNATARLILVGFAVKKSSLIRLNPT